jgi:16S rRNA G966 N2-methylase RsmD
MTYSNSGETVLDFCMGSGSCGVSAKLTGRKFIGVEMSPEYFEIAQTRIVAADSAAVTPADHQLTTQLPEGMQTTPDRKYEQGVLEKIRNPQQQSDPSVDLFEEQ